MLQKMSEKDQVLVLSLVVGIFCGLASVLLKALNKVTLKNGRKVVLEVASENTGNSDSSGKKRDRSEKSARKGSSSRKAKAEAPAQHKMKKDDWMQFFDEDSANAGDGWWEKKKRKK